MVSPVPAEVALARLTPEERAWVVDFRDRLRAMLGDRVRDLRLFGSKVRGDFHDESDIDILVLLDESDHTTGMAIARLAYEISPVLAPVSFTFERYHRPANRASGFYKAMRKESVRL
ncbi:MAG: nucleotidyltransferase family protein [Acidimicrobiia bacterium]